MDFKIMKNVITAALTLLFVLNIGPLKAATYDFGCLTNNSGDCSSIEPLFTLDVTGNDTQTDFKFSVADTGPNAAIKEIYFGDLSSLLDPTTATLDETGGTVAGGGVDFQPIDVPAENFPAGFTATFSSEAEPPSGNDKNGIDNGEWLGNKSILMGIVKHLKRGKTRLKILLEG